MNEFHQDAKEKLKSLFTTPLTQNVELHIVSHSTEDTKLIGNLFASYLKRGNIISLTGELGAGKTVFMSGFASYYHIEDKISSPTFTIVNEYTTSSTPIYHFDVYRIANENEFLVGIGTEYFEQGICIIEWGELIKSILPPDTIYITITKDATQEDLRYITIRRNLS